MRFFKKLGDKEEIGNTQYQIILPLVVDNFIYKMHEYLDTHYLKSDNDNNHKKLYLMAVATLEQTTAVDAALLDLKHKLITYHTNNNNIPDNEVDDLRNKLLTILSNTNDAATSVLAHGILIGLTELAPINTMSYYTQESIENQNKVFLATGHVFDLDADLHYFFKLFNGDDISVTSEESSISPTNVNWWQSDDVNKFIKQIQKQNFTLTNAWTKSKLLQADTLHIAERFEKWLAVKLQPPHPIRASTN